MSFDIINPDALGRPRGWNHGMLGPAQGRVLFVAGQIGVDASDSGTPTGLVEQWERALARVVAVVRAAGGAPEDIGRIAVYVTDLAAYHKGLKPLGEAHRRLLRGHYPAMALVEVKALVDPRALVEMEATAVLP